jgi:hypothetical protein
MFILVPWLAAGRSLLRYWPPFSLPDIGSTLQRFLISHSNARGGVISAAGGCQYLAMEMAASTETVST